MNVKDLSSTEILEFTEFINNEFIFEYDQEKLKFFGTLGNVNFNIFRESVDDFIIQMFVTKDADIFLSELVFEELCCKRFHELGLTNYKFEQYSHGSFLRNVDKLKYGYFAKTFCSKIKEYITKEI